MYQRKCQKMTHILRPLHLYGKSRRSSRLLSSAWPSPGCYGSLKSEPVDGSLLFLCVFLSFPNSDFQIKVLKIIFLSWYSHQSCGTAWYTASSDTSIPYEIQLKSQLLQFWSGSLLRFLGKQWKIAQGIGPLSWSPRLLQALTWPSPVHCSHVGEGCLTSK